MKFIGDRRSSPGITAHAVGQKAANLARLDHLGLRIPPALALGVDLCEHYAAHRALPPEFAAQLTGALKQLETSTGSALGNGRPLLLAIRSSPRVSLPGMLETVLNVGLTEQAVHALVRRTGDAWLAWDAYRRLIRSFGEIVCGLTAADFETVERAGLARAAVRGLDELDAATMRNLARDGADLLRQHGHPLPEDPLTQVVEAVEAVIRSWWSPRAHAYRTLNHLDEAPGTGVLIQAMVFGNSGPRSGAGVGFTRHPATGGDALFVEFVPNAQGEDIVSGRVMVAASNVLATLLPVAWRELTAAKGPLEREFRDMQEFEFTIADGRLFFLQARAGKRTPLAAVQIAVDLVRQRLITEDEALERLAEYDLTDITQIRLAPGADDVPLGRGIAAASGVASGAIAFDSVRAAALSAHGPVVLVRPEMATDDIEGISVAAGVLTALGGATSHAAVVARQLGKVCVVSCADLRIDAAARRCWLGDRRFNEGDLVTLDGQGGGVYAGRVPVVLTRPEEALASVARWRHTLEAGRLTA